MKKIIYILTVLPLLSFFTSYAQDAPTTPVQPAPDFPEYIVRPSEDLNPYGLSSLGESTEQDYRDGAGTLGTKTTGRPSNRDVNKKAEEKRAENRANTQNQAVDQIVVEDDAAVQNFSSAPKSGSSSMIRWVDDQGVTHITNNIGAVPPEYRDRIE